MPLLALGLVLGVVCVLGFAAIVATLGNRVSVLVVARPVPAGQVIVGADLKQVPAAEADALGLIPVARSGEVEGRTAAVPLVPGALLTKNMIGKAVFPPAGQVVTSLALKAGQFPAGVSAGAAVALYLNPPASANSASGSGPARVPGTVLTVDPAGDGQGATVITVLLAAVDGSRVAATPAANVVVMLSTPDGN